MMPTSSKRGREIESWFRKHGDGEFVIMPPEHGSIVLGDRAASRTIIYTTKLSCLAQNLHAFDVAHPVMMLGRYGLPLATDLSHLDGTPFGMRYHFLGDADPPDILAFAWLREHVAIGWLGVNDALLNGSQNSADVLTALPMSEAERASMQVLPTLCPDFRDLLGPYRA